MQLPQDATGWPNFREHDRYLRRKQGSTSSRLGSVYDAVTGICNWLKTFPVSGRDTNAPSGPSENVRMFD